MRVSAILLLFLGLGCTPRQQEYGYADLLDRNTMALKRHYHILEKAYNESAADAGGSESTLLWNHFEESFSAYMMDDSMRGWKVNRPQLIREINLGLRQMGSDTVNWKENTPTSENQTTGHRLEENDFWITRLAFAEKILALSLEKRNEAFALVRPVISCSQYDQLKRGNNAIFDVAFKSEKSDFVEIRILSVMLDGKALPLNSVEVDRHTQRFILHNISRGKYRIAGQLLLTDITGKQRPHNFSEEFEVE